MTVTATPLPDNMRVKAFSDYRKKLLEHKEIEGRLKESKCHPVTRSLDLNLIELFILEREEIKELTKLYDKSENDLKALQSVGQIVGEVLKQLTEDKCKYYPRRFR